MLLLVAILPAWKFLTMALLMMRRFVHEIFKDFTSKLQKFFCSRSAVYSILHSLRFCAIFATDAIQCFIVQYLFVFAGLG